MEKNSLKKLYIYFFFVGILIFHAFYWCVYCQYTELSCDEFFSYGLANETDEHIFFDENQIDKYENNSGWILGDNLQSYLTVDEGERFEYDNVWQNQQHDVHPPLYYLLIHTISSFIPNEFSKWIGKGLNIAWLLLTDFVIWKLAGLFIKNKWSTLVAPFIWGLSLGTFYLSSYVRMYAQLTFFCILITYLLFKMYLEHAKKTIYPEVCIVITLGGLTHYYFFLYLAIFSILCGIVLLIRKVDWKEIRIYCVHFLIGGMSAILIFPDMLTQIFNGYQGDNVREGFFNAEFQLERGMYFITNDVFWGKTGYIILVIGILLLIYVIKKGIHSLFQISNKKIIWMVWLLTGILYAIVIMKMSIKVRAYYLSPCYAAILIPFILLFIKLLEGLLGRIQFLLYAVVIVWLISGPVKTQLHYVKSYNEITVNFMKDYAKYEDRDCIYIYDGWDNIFSDQIGRLTKQDEIYCLDVRDIGNIDYEKILEGRRTKDELLILIEDNEKEEQYITFLEKKMGADLEEVMTLYCSYYIVK